MKRNSITLGSGYTYSISMVFDDESLVELVYGALKQAQQIGVEYLGLKTYLIASDIPQFKMEFKDIIEPEEFVTIKKCYDAEKLEEANRLAKEAAIEVAYAEQELQLAA